MYIPGPQIPYDPTAGWKSKPHLASSRTKRSFNKKWFWIGIVILAAYSIFNITGWGNEEPQDVPVPERVVPAP